MLSVNMLSFFYFVIVMRSLIFSLIRPNAITMSVIMLNVVMISVAMCYCYDECRYGFVSVQWPVL
jgi:hypothetical protein